MKKALIVIVIGILLYLGVMQVQNTQRISILEEKLYSLNNKTEPYIVSNYLDDDTEEANNNILLTSVTTKLTEKFEPIVSKNVYLTNTGSKYHKFGCRYLKTSCTEVSLDQAISMGKTACKVCKP